MDNKLEVVTLRECSIVIDDMLLNVVFSLQGNMPYKAQRTEFHQHTFTELFFCRQGQITLRFTDSEMVLSAGDIAVIPAGVSHRRVPNCEEQNAVWQSISYFCTRHQSGRKGKMLEHFRSIAANSLPVFLHEQGGLCDELSAITKDIPMVRPEFTALRVATLLMHIIEIAGFQKNDYIEEIRRVDMYRVAQLEHVLDKDYMRDIKISEVAKTLYLSSRQLERIMHRYFGMSWRQARLEKRLTFASEQLRNTDTKIEDISIAVGFSNTSTFYRNFSNKFHITPDAYRKKYQQQMQTENKPD